jgi:hypothetical protein
MNIEKERYLKNQPIDRYLAIAGAMLCLVVTVFIERIVSQQQSLLPLPGFYFLEMLILSCLMLWTVLRGKPSSVYITWAACGIFTAFWLLGALSIGFFYLPITILFGGSGIIAELTKKGHLQAHIVTFFLAGILQAGMMLVLIRLV